MILEPILCQAGGKTKKVLLYYEKASLNSWLHLDMLGHRLKQYQTSSVIVDQYKNSRVIATRFSAEITDDNVF